MRVADFLFLLLHQQYKVDTVFMISGGGAMYLVDALGRREGIKYVSPLHEQAAAMAAEGYARIRNQPGVVLVTSGPGGGNAVTGVMGAWLDSIPMLVISGQVKRETTILAAPELRLRQLGDQEINITDIVKPITKYAKIVNDVKAVKYHLCRAMYLATHGRPGPVWLDIPLDIQSSEINIEEQIEYDPTIDRYEAPSFENLEDQVNNIIERLSSAKRPVIIAGNGIRLSGAEESFLRLVDRLKIPVLTSISGIDIIPSDSRFFFGRPGILGERCANFIIQNSDMILVLGARLGIRIIGYDYASFARCAYKIMVDIDKNELYKPTLKIDMKIHADVATFIMKMYNLIDNIKLTDNTSWLLYCNNIKSKYPLVLEEHRNISDYVSSYVFPEELSKLLTGNEIIVTGNGTAYTSTFQTIKIRKGNRMFANEGCASMGFDLPASIGAALAAPNRPVICITGDGSIQMNIQELQTIMTENLNIKIFMYNNNGYLSIKNTQKTFFEGHFVGSTSESGVTLPDMKKIAACYGYHVDSIKNHRELKEKLAKILKINGPVFCEVLTDPFEVLGPKVASMKMPDGTMISRPLEDLAPFLPRDEFNKNMLIPSI